MKNFKTLLKNSPELRNEWSNLIGEWGLRYNDEECKEIYPKLCELEVNIEEVDQYGGEDMGSEYYYIFSVEKNGILTNYKLNGFYQSYHGVEFYDKLDFHEVEEKEVMVKEWVAV